MLDYKSIITKRYVLHMTLRDIATDTGGSKSGIGDFLRAFENCKELSVPLPPGITNEGIALKVYGHIPGETGRDTSYEYPDYVKVFEELNNKKNMTLQWCWNKYTRRCSNNGLKSYQYRQFCQLFGQWCEDNYETAHFNAIIAQSMEVDFAGQTFDLIDRLTGEIIKIVVYVAVLPYSQYIYAEGMISTKDPQWIEVNNHALQFFGGVPALVICDNCKQAVIANKDWIQPELNQSYTEWAEYNHTVILPAKVKHPKYKPSVENSVGILEKGFFHDLAERQYFSLQQFNEDLWEKKKEHCRSYYWEEEQKELMPLPSTQYHYMERAEATVSGDFHIRYDNAYYSVGKEYIHQKVTVRTSDSEVKIFDKEGTLIKTWSRALHKGEWKTDKNDLPVNYRDYSEWNSTYFISRASTVGKYTTEAIKTILKSRKLEVQTYRLCIGVLGFTRKYSREALEECCKRALDANRVTYTYIKNTIPEIADELGDDGYRTQNHSDRNSGAYVMNDSYSDMNKLLQRSHDLAEKSEKEAR